MPYYTYVVKSIRRDYFYKGHCEDLSLRVKQHNAGMTESLKPYLPVELVYFEEFVLLQDAISREKYFKTSAGRRFLKTKLAVRTGIE